MQKVSFETLSVNPYILDSVNAVTERAIQKYPSLIFWEEEIKQELWEIIERCKDVFTPDKGACIQTFVRGVLDRRIHNLCKKYCSINKTKQYCTLSITSNEAESVPSRESVYYDCFRKDVNAVVNTLPENQKKVCFLIMDGFSVSQTAKKMNLSMRYFQKHYISPIREEFRKNGF